MKEHTWLEMQQLESRVGLKAGLSGISTGFPDLDLLTAGLQGGDLIVLGGATSMGKSSLAYGIVAHAAIIRGEPVALVSLESPPGKSVQRILCATGYVDRSRYARGDLRHEDYARLGQAAGALGAAPIDLVYAPRILIDDLVQHVRELHEKQPVRLLVVDTLNLIRVAGFSPPATNREQEVGVIVRDLKALALELNVPVLVTAGLRRGIEQRQNKRPQLSDLRDSGEVENTADLVLFLDRPESHHRPTEQEGYGAERRAEVIVAKNRHGPTGTISLGFHPGFGAFYPVPSTPPRKPARSSPRSGDSTGRATPSA